MQHIFKTIEKRVLDYTSKSLVGEPADLIDATKQVVRQFEKDAPNLSAERIEELMLRLAAIGVMGLKMCEEEATRRFHVQRRMFALKEDKVTLAKEGDVRSHSQWLKESHGIQLDDSITRGYFDKSGLYFYSGPDFLFTNNDWRLIKSALPILMLYFSMPNETPIYAGVVPDKPGERWRARQRIGILEEYYRWVEIPKQDPTTVCSPRRYVDFRDPDNRGILEVATQKVVWTSHDAFTSYDGPSTISVD